MTFDAFMYEHPVIMLLVLFAYCAVGWLIANALWRK